MRILDAPLLDYKRKRPCCEWCGRPRPRGETLTVHHILAKGMGGGGQLDTALNTLSVCWLPCHVLIQDGGKATRDRCLEIVAEREGLESGQVVLEALYALLRRPK